MKLFTKGLVIVAAVALLVGVAVPAANALTQAEASAIITALGLSGSQADVINALVSGGSAPAASCSYTRDLTVGSTGADVTDLQMMLVASGNLVMPAGVDYGYFGSLTQSALAGYQAANGIAPAAGYFGPITRSSITCDADADVDMDDDSDLMGGAGSVDTYELVSSLNNEEVGVGEDDVEVYGVEIEAEDGSDLEIMALKLDFDQGTAANDDFGDYFSDVTVWFDGEKVADVDADEFDEDNNYVQTLSLDSGATIEAGDTEEIVVALSGISNADSDDEGDTWTLDVTSVRYKDAQGSIISEDPTLAARTFSLESFSTSADIAVKITKGDEDVNDAHMINIDQNDETNNVPVLSFDVEVEGDSDVNIDDLVVEFTTTGAANVDEMASAIYLLMDGDEVGNENVPANEDTVTFDNIDVTIDAGDTVEFVVAVDLLAEGDGVIDYADSILVTVGETETDLWDIEDEEGDDIADADLTGSAASDASVVYDVVFDVESDGWETIDVKSSDTATIDEEVTFAIDLDITAIDGDVYIEGACTEDNDGTIGAGATGFNFSSINNADSAASCNVTSTADAGTTADYVVEEGETETFTVTVVNVADVASDFAQNTLEGINWSEADEAGDIIFTGSLNDMYKSASVYINTR